MLDERGAQTVPIPRLGHGHGHGHGHRRLVAASGRVRSVVAVLLVPFALAAVVGMVVLFEPVGAGRSGPVGAQPVRADVVSVVSGVCGAAASGGESGGGCLTVTVRMSEGVAAGRAVALIVPVEPSTPRFVVGDHVVLAYAGGDPLRGQSYALVDFQRGTPLVLLAVLFALAVVVLGRWQGVKALVALGLSFAVLVLFVLPSILAGHNPLLVAVSGGGVIMFAVLYLTHGFSARTSIAVLGTLVSLGLVAALGVLFAAAAMLTGLGGETDVLIGSLGHGIDTRGLLLAGLVIGAIGVLDDVTVTQTSAVWELREANPALGWRELHRAGMRIGRDHVSSAVNTLVMAYAGAALPVLLYSSLGGVGLGGILSSELIAQQVLSTLVGSIGLVASVPVTTALASVVVSQEHATTR